MVVSLRVLPVVTAEFTLRRPFAATDPLVCLSFVLDASDLKFSPDPRTRGGAMLFASRDYRER